eukprot:3542460-Rhodomonas_salina.1
MASTGPLSTSGAGSLKASRTLVSVHETSLKSSGGSLGLRGKRDERIDRTASVNAEGVGSAGGQTSPRLCCRTRRRGHTAAHLLEPALPHRRAVAVLQLQLGGDNWGGESPREGHAGVCDRCDPQSLHRLGQLAGVDRAERSGAFLLEPVQVASKDLEPVAGCWAQPAHDPFGLREDLRELRVRFARDVHWLLQALRLRVRPERNAVPKHGGLPDCYCRSNPLQRNPGIVQIRWAIDLGNDRQPRGSNRGPGRRSS